MKDFVLPSGWTLEQLGDIADVKGGKRMPKGESLTKENTGQIYFRVSDMNEEGAVLDDLHYVPHHVMDKIKRYRVKAGDLYIVVVGATIGKSGMVPQELDGANLTENANKITAINAEPVYLLNVIRSDIVQQTIDRLKTDNAQPKLALTRIRKFPIPLPPLAEQKRIAEILGTWDSAIAQVEALVNALTERKKGLMQRLLLVFGDDSEPEKRFPDFESEWGKRKISDIFDRVKRKNDIGNENPLTISAQYGLVSQTEYFNKQVASKNLENYYLLEHGEFAYNKSYSEGYPFGAIKRLDDYDAGALSTLYICFQLANNGYSSDFYRHFFEAGGLNEGIYQIAYEGARNHGLLNVGISDFFNLKLPAPSVDEQEQLAGFFNMLDQEIDEVSLYLDNLRAQKKGLMQRLLTGEVRVKV